MCKMEKVDNWYQVLNVGILYKQTMVIFMNQTLISN
jgi:hypothetical protein